MAVANSAMVPYEEAVRRGLQFSEKEWMALSSGRQGAIIANHDNPPLIEKPSSGPLTLLRYRQIKAMLVARGKKDPPHVPQGYSYGDWHRALSELAGEIDEAKFRGLWIQTGPKRARVRVEFSDLIDGEADPGHPATTVTQEEWREIVKKALAMVREPVAPTPEVAAAERIADEKEQALEKANRRIEELEERLRKSEQPAAS